MGAQYGSSTEVTDAAPDPPFFGLPLGGMFVDLRLVGRKPLQVWGRRGEKVKGLGR